MLVDADVPLMQPSSPASEVSQQDIQQRAPLAAVFVARFDQTIGYIIDWKTGVEDLSGVEFKVMPSGSHEVTTDLILFSHMKLFGIAFFRTLVNHNQLQHQRGAEMVAVGVLSETLAGLDEHSGDLKIFSATVMSNRKEIYGPELQEFYEAFQKQTLIELPLESQALFKPVQLIYRYGVKIFTIWRYSLLRKRILILCDSPVEAACREVYSVFQLGAPYNLNDETNSSELLKFYVALSNITEIEGKDSFIACTSDKICQKKTQLYDLLINYTNKNISQTESKFKVSKRDKFRFTALLEICGITPRTKKLSRSKVEPVSLVTGKEEAQLNSKVTRYFNILNQRIYEGLCNSRSTSITAQEVERLGLDPKHDASFLEEYCYSFNIPIDFTDLKAQNSIMGSCARR